MSLRVRSFARSVPPLPLRALAPITPRHPLARRTERISMAAITLVAALKFAPRLAVAVRTVWHTHGVHDLLWRELLHPVWVAATALWTMRLVYSAVDRWLCDRHGIAVRAPAAPATPLQQIVERSVARASGARFRAGWWARCWAVAPYEIRLWPHEHGQVLLAVVEHAVHRDRSRIVLVARCRGRRGVLRRLLVCQRRYGYPTAGLLRAASRAAEHLAAQG